MSKIGYNDKKYVLTKLKMNKKAFSFIEVIISVTIMTVLWVIAVSTSNNLKSNSDNSRVIADISSIKNALVSYKWVDRELPSVMWNKNFYDSIGVYTWSVTWAFWEYWQFTEKTLNKAYLNFTPLDPKTNSYYSYGKAIAKNQFEIAWVIKIQNQYSTKVVWDYTAENWPFSLIRSFNSNYFVVDDGMYLPYNPEERALIATDRNWYIYKKWDTISTWAWENKEIYFSDGSVSVITENSSITLTEMDFPSETNLISKILITLDAGSIWTKATKLDSESSFEVWSTDTAATVRWTIFWVDKQSSYTTVTVIEWSVEVRDISQGSDWVAPDTEPRTIEAWTSITNYRWGFEESDVTGESYEDLFSTPYLEMNLEIEEPNFDELWIIIEDEDDEIEWSCNINGTKVWSWEIIDLYDCSRDANGNRYNTESFTCNNWEISKSTEGTDTTTDQTFNLSHYYTNSESCELENKEAEESGEIVCGDWESGFKLNSYNIKPEWFKWNEENWCIAKEWEYKLVAFADYTQDLNLYSYEGVTITKYQSDSLNAETNSWVLVGADKYLKYQWLNDFLWDDFIIEMEIDWLERDDSKYYLLDSWDWELKVYLKNCELNIEYNNIVKNIISFCGDYNINTWFNKLKIEKSINQVSKSQIEVYVNWSSIDTLVYEDSVYISTLYVWILKDYLNNNWLNYIKNIYIYK